MLCNKPTTTLNQSRHYPPRSRLSHHMEAPCPAVENVRRDRGLRSPPDDWEGTPVAWRRTQSSDEKYVADPARRLHHRPEGPAPADPSARLTGQPQPPAAAAGLIAGPRRRISEEPGLLGCSGLHPGDQRRVGLLHHGQVKALGAAGGVHAVHLDDAPLLPAAPCLGELQVQAAP